MMFQVLIAGALLWCSSTPPKAVELRAGDPAPYAGTLIAHDLAFQCASCVKVDLPGCQAERKADAALCSIKLLRLGEERDAEKERGDILAARLAAGFTEPEIPWYEYPILWGALGFIAGGVVVGLIVWQAVEP